jgi:hypothetical protein
MQYSMNVDGGCVWPLTSSGIALAQWTMADRLQWTCGSVLASVPTQAELTGYSRQGYNQSDRPRLP